MTPHEAIDILERHNQWRLGNEDYPMLDPKQITGAIIVVTNELKGYLENDKPKTK